MASKPGTILVTGAFSGIGEATVLHFLRKGWTVYAAGRNLKRAENLEREAAAAGAGAAERLQLLKLDVTSAEERAAALKKIAAQSGSLDCLVNNAGYGLMGPVTDATIEQIRHQFEVNTFAPACLIRDALPLMNKSTRGRIVNISSGLGRFVLPGTGIYSASKFALEALSDALRVELKSEKGDIKVVVVEPGVIKTRFNENIEQAKSETPLAELLREARLKFNHRRATVAGPESVARVIYRAATARSPSARYVVTMEAKASVILFKFAPSGLLDGIMSSMIGIRRLRRSEKR